METKWCHIQVSDDEGFHIENYLFFKIVGKKLNLYVAHLAYIYIIKIF